MALHKTGYLMKNNIIFERGFCIFTKEVFLKIIIILGQISFL